MFWPLRSSLYSSTRKATGTTKLAKSTSRKCTNFFGRSSISERCKSFPWSCWHTGKWPRLYDQYTVHTTIRSCINDNAKCPNRYRHIMYDWMYLGYLFVNGINRIESEIHGVRRRKREYCPGRHDLDSYTDFPPCRHHCIYDRAKAVKNIL